MTAAYLSVVTQKLRLRLRMCVARVSYVINIYYYAPEANEKYHNALSKGISASSRYTEFSNVFTSEEK